MRSTLKAALVGLVVAISTFGATEAQAAPPRRAATDNGAFVVMNSAPEKGNVSFSYGWNNTSQFESPAVGYWLGIYDITNSHYVWASDNVLPPSLTHGAPGTIEWSSVNLQYMSDLQLPPGDYAINFFVRSSYAGPVTNNAVVQLMFSVR